MSLFALKALIAGSIGVGMVAIPASTLSLISRNGNKRMVYMIAEGPQGLVKLFVTKENQIPEKPEVQRSEDPKYKIEAWYNEKPVKEKLMLCSPEETKQNYWLLKQENGGYYQQNLNGVGGSKICDSMRDANGLDSMSKLSIKIVTKTPSSSSTNLPKTILLENCSITSTSSQQSESDPTKPDALKINCQDKNKHTTVEITTQEFKALS